MTKFPNTETTESLFAILTKEGLLKYVETKIVKNKKEYRPIINFLKKMIAYIDEPRDNIDKISFCAGFWVCVSLYMRHIEANTMEKEDTEAEIKLLKTYIDHLEKEINDIK